MLLLKSAREELLTAAKMQAVWLSLSENVKCVGKLSVEVRRQVKRRRRPSNEPYEPRSGRTSEGTGKLGTSTFKRNSGHKEEASARIFGMSIEDASRKIVEMIYQAALRDSKGPKPVISHVLKIVNSTETRRRFEDHREAIKRKENAKRENRHSRVLVDGNEFLQFYGTTMRQSCTEANSLCKDLSCGVCRTIRTGFEVECKDKMGIVFSTTASEFLHGDGNARRAVILCRTIAGVTGSMKEMNEACDSVRSTAGSKLDYLIVRNPRAVLPCFIIVFDN